MHAKYFLCVLGLTVFAVSPAGAQVTGGVLSATQTHMS
jgi:hypothetical protein